MTKMTMIAPNATTAILPPGLEICDKMKDVRPHKGPSIIEKKILKAYLNRHKPYKTAAISFLANLFLKQGIS